MKKLRISEQAAILTFHSVGSYGHQETRHFPPQTPLFRHVADLTFISL